MSDRDKVIKILRFIQKSILSIEEKEKNPIDQLHGYKLMGMRKAYSFCEYGLKNEFDITKEEIDAQLKPLDSSDV